MSVSVPAMNSAMGRMAGSMGGPLGGALGPLSSLLGSYEGSLMVGATPTSSPPRTSPHPSPRASPRVASPQGSPRTSPHHNGWGYPPLQVKQEPRDHDSSGTSGVSSMAHTSFLSGTNTSPSSSSSAGSPPGYPSTGYATGYPASYPNGYPPQRALSPRRASPVPPHSTPLGPASNPGAVPEPSSSPHRDTAPASGQTAATPNGRPPRTPGSTGSADDNNSRSSTCSYSEDDADEQVRRLRTILDHAASGSGLQCHLCSFTADSRERLAEHAAAHYKCSLCDAPTGSADGLRAHLQDAHDLQLSPGHPEPNPCDNGYLEETDESVATPRVNSQGKVKTFRCKQCEFVAVTKLDFWEHTKLHIKQEKLLCCPKCPFVTEYKHHLEYHLRNHFNSKPFKCDKCPYSCVNKSMLNSHLKSHSNVYQYRCADCTYATKYCHSLKLHLRKYGHQPSMVLNPDGTPNPLPIIDVYGTRRGPKTKTSKAAQQVLQQQQQAPQQQQQQQIQVTPQQFGVFPNPYGLPPIFPYGPAPPRDLAAPGAAPNANPAGRQGSPLAHRCNYCDFTTSEAELLAQHMFVHAESNLMQYFTANNNNYYGGQEGIKEYLGKVPPPVRQPSPPTLATPAAPAPPPPPAQPGSPPRTPSSPSMARSGSVPNGGRPSGGTPLDLSKPEASEEVRESRGEPRGELRGETKNRRKGRAFKLERIALRLQSTEDYVEPEQVPAKVPRVGADLTVVPAVPSATPALATSPELKLSARSPSPPSSPVTATSVPLTAAAGVAPSVPGKEEYNCSYCDIAFRDIVMYTMHMGYHGYQDPFQCNMCGQQTTDKVAFFLHIARSSHS